MEICKKKTILQISLIFFLILINTNFSCADISFKNLENKKVSYLDFFFLKFENKLFSRSQSLRRQAIATRVQFSNVGTQIDYDQNDNRISIEIYAVMDRARYSKKKYKQKLSDCNQVRNLIFYQKNGYSFFKQTRKSNLSEEIMKEIFIESFFENINFNKKEIQFLLDKMFVKVTVFHPVYKTELVCSGKVNDYELK